MQAGHFKSPKPLPRLWLMTDERIDTVSLMRAVERLPRGAGVVFRHYGLPALERRALFADIRGVARRRGLVLMLAGPAWMAAAWRAHGWHGRDVDRWRARTMLHSAPVHGLMEMRAAEKRGADLLFLSPVFATRSHPGGVTLGPARFGLFARMARRHVIALGGMTAHRAARLKRLGAYGWAAIDGLSA